MELKQVKATIFKTDCQKYMYAGLSCSEPIMTLASDGKLVDNYIIFPRNVKSMVTGAPVFMFGINTREESVVYVDEDIFGSFDQIAFEEHFEEQETVRKARIEYTDLFPLVREMCVGEREKDNDLISKYVSSLRIISGDALFSIYKKLFPQFFEWAEN